MKINYHSHHLVPKHAGGTGDPSNLVKVNVAMHAFMHRLRYIEIGDLWDKIAYESLSGLITHAEAAHQARKKFARLNPDHHSNAGKKGGQAPASERTKQTAKIAAASLGKMPWWNNGLNNKRSHTCPDGGYVSGKLPHGKHKRTYTQCPHCGMSCNLSNLSRHILSKHS